MMIALVCPNCAGPLPSEAMSLPRVICGYCSVTLLPDTRVFKQAEGSVAKAPDEERQSRRAAFYMAVAEAKGEGDPAETLRAALQQHLGLGSEVDVVVTVVMGLVAEFEEDTGINVSGDGRVIHRIAEAYLKASTELASSDRSEMNLPFLAADETGPKHMVRMIAVADIQALALGQRAPSRPPRAQQAAAPAEDQAPSNKKWWWPF